MGERVFVPDKETPEHKAKKEFARLRKAKGTTDEEKMYMDLVERKIGMAENK